MCNIANNNPDVIINLLYEKITWFYIKYKLLTVF